MDEFWKILVAGVPAGIAIVGIYIAGRLNLANQRSLSVRAAREDAFSKIAASEFTLSQALVNVMNLSTDFELHRRKWLLIGGATDSFHLTEARRAVDLLEKAIAKVAEELGLLATAVGKARIAYPRTHALEALCDAVTKDYRAPTVRELAPGATAAELDAWHLGAKASHGKFVHDTYGDPIRGLLQAMRERVDDGC